MLGQGKVAHLSATIVAGVALVASGCQTDRETTEPEPVPVTEERLAAALLTADDLPSFAAADSETPISTEAIAEHACDDAIAGLEPREEATADFAGSGTLLTSTVAWFPGGAGAAEQVFRDVAEDCAAVVAVDEDIAVRTSALRFGVLSDDTLAMDIQIEREGSAIEERDLIVMRVGDLLGVIRLTGPRPSDKELLDRTVRLALGRLGLLADETS